jgi:hypothetical protein
VDEEPRFGLAPRGQKSDQLVAEPSLTTDSVFPGQAIQDVASQPSDVVGEHGMAVALLERFDVGKASPVCELSDPPVDLPIHDLLIQARGKRFPIVLTRHEN